ncbi:tyrosine-type recombinase/integrase [Shewanella gaetbuli]|uniref:Tyrosine-type recombinase/integrase n=1 Tax=Shewanella gaetbuli TaxID=220752 RepID=A0A9X1ZVN4_9GAMM|nr:tyrosine-type recombinase/integrase [Shewanella gaetbuli]MCL1143211.1 tyrosine-type recombinase/integrase [Shewanella gaetbuli]
MENIKVRHFIKRLIETGKLHPLYREVFDAFVEQNEHAVEDDSESKVDDAQSKIEADFYQSYKNLLGHLKKRFILSETKILPDELEALIAQLKPAVLSKQTQLLILQSILNYAKKHHGIDSPNIPSIVTLKRDKPILSPVELVKLPIVDMLYTLLDKELISPNRALSKNEKLGRAALLVYLTVNVSKTQELLSILEHPKDVFYVGGICYWQKQQTITAPKRYILSDVAVMALQQWVNVNQSSSKIQACIVKYLNTTSEFDWSDLSILKLRTLRKIHNILHLGPVQYQMYFLPSVSQALPEHPLMRILTNKACLHSEPHLLGVSERGTNKFNQWRHMVNNNHCFIAIDITLKQLDDIFFKLNLLKERNEPRVTCLAFVSDMLQSSELTANPYLWLLCSWLFSLLKDGGTYKRRLKLATTVDYVRSLSKPFLAVFSTCDLGLLSGEDWANKLNESAETFTSAQRKKYIYYFAQFLVETNLVRDLCLSDIDVVGSSSKVDANLISPSHIDEVLGYLTEHVQDDVVYQYAYFLLCFCFYSGLRRNEASKLTWADFSFAVKAPTIDEFDYVQLSVRPNQHRSLKTTSARRELPLDALWPKTAIEKLRVRYQIQQHSGTNKKALLFDDANRVNQAYELISDLIRHFTKDYTLRIHHLRHSFANWSWCRLNPRIIKQGRTQLTMLDHQMFDDDYLQRLQTRLRYNMNSRKKMFILAHLMGHKDVQSTLNSYLHLKDILYYLELKPYFNLTKYFTSECVGRVSWLEPEQGLSLAERLNYYTRDTEAKLAIQPAPLTSSLSVPTFSNYVREIKPNCEISSMTWARALNALKVSSVIESSQYYNVPLEELQQLLNNAKQVHQHYPRVSKRLPLIPAFPRLPHADDAAKVDVFVAKSSKVFMYLCNKFDKSIGVEPFTLSNVRLSMEILNYAVPGKDFALRCPDSTVSRIFIRFCQLMGLKDRHLKFRFHRADLTKDKEQSKAIEYRWKKTIKDYGFNENNFVVASESEGRFLGKHDGNGFLEIALVNNRYKRVQRHKSLFSFLHFLLILSYQGK